MNALDIAARGLAQRALESQVTLASPAGAASVGTDNAGSVQDFIDETWQGAANLRSRTAPTATALEALSAEYVALTGYAGDVHTVETAPYLKRDNLVLALNGAELRNVSATPLSTNDIVSVTLPVGNDTFGAAANLTYHTIVSTAGMKLTLEAGHGSSFAAGDKVRLRGATTAVVSSYSIERNSLLARVIGVTGDVIEIDRAPPQELVDDTPSIGNTAEGVPSALPSTGDYYLLYRPRVYGGKLSSALGGALKWGGVIDGYFADLDIYGRNGIVLNALQDCLFDGFRVTCWRKAVEIAHGSYGTTIRNLRASFLDAADHEVLTTALFMGIHENSAHCVVEDFVVDTGPNIVPSSGAAVRLGSGHHNEMRNGTIRLPAHTGVGLMFTAYAEAGNPCTANQFLNIRVIQPNASTFLIFSDGGAGIVDCTVRGCRFEGAVTVRACSIVGSGHRIEDNHFAAGSFYFNGAPTNCVIRGNYLPGGFENLTDALLKTNTIHDNESDASRRLNAAANVTVADNTSVTTTTANSVYQSATFAAGDLGPGDRIFVRSEAHAGGSTGNNRFGALSLTANAVRTGIGSVTKTANGNPMGFDSVIRIVSDNGTNAVISYKTLSGDTWKENRVAIASLQTNALTVAVEYWVQNAVDPVTAREVRIIPVKPGMKHLPFK
jgi:hypothetical protein